MTDGCNYFMDKIEMRTGHNALSVAASILVDVVDCHVKTVHNL